ncbi:MAG: AEC family transporter [Vicinamibacterales bacterium]
MRAILDVTFPFFALIAAGYISVWREWTPVAAMRALNQFVLHVALPCMLFKFGAGLDLAHTRPAAVPPVYIAGVVLYGAIVAAGRSRHMRWKELSFVALATVFPNTGFMGVPLVVSMIGDVRERRRWRSCCSTWWPRPCRWQRQHSTDTTGREPAGPFVTRSQV